MALSKYGIDFVGPQKILGVSVSPQDISYRISDIKHVQYLDLADSRLIIKEIQKDHNALEFDELVYYKHVKFELMENEININKRLITDYTTHFEKTRSRTYPSDINKFFKLFDVIVGLGSDFSTARDHTVLLMKVMRQKHTESAVVVKNMIQYLFSDKLVIKFFLTFRPITDNYIPFHSNYGKCSWTLSLTDVCHNYRICPVLGSAFGLNRTLLHILTQYNVLKKDFYFMYMPLHNILIVFPEYAAFAPIADDTLVTLDNDKFTRRDHILFEIVVTHILTNTLRNTQKNIGRIIDSFRLIYKCLPYAYMSESEITSRMHHLSPDLDESCVTSVISTYQNMFPETGKETCPRSLQDLSRCAVRNSFNGNFSVNLAVETLILPEELKSFLMLEDEIV